MTTKITSEEAYAYLQQTELVSTPEIVFGRAEVEKTLEEVGRAEDVVSPSGKSFLDWARRYGIVEPVEGSRGLYRWAPSVEEKAAEVGRQIAAGVDPVDPEPNAIAVTDMDPENPMILNLAIDGVPRLPRKMKKRMKRDLTANTSARKVTISFAGADR